MSSESHHHHSKQSSSEEVRSRCSLAVHAFDRGYWILQPTFQSCSDTACLLHAVLDSHFQRVNPTLEDGI